MEARFRFAVGRKQVGHRLHFSPPGGVWDRSDVERFASVLGEWWYEPGGPYYPPAHFQGSATSLVDVLASYAPVGGPPWLRFALKLVIGLAGSSVGPAIPPDSSPVLRLSGRGPWRRSSGRVFLVGWPASFCEGAALEEVSSVPAGDVVDTWGGLPAFLADAYAPGPAPSWVVWNESRQVGGDAAMPAVTLIDAVTMPKRDLRSTRLRLVGQAPYAREANPAA